MLRTITTMAVLGSLQLACKPMGLSGDKSVDALVNGDASDQRNNSECGPGALLGPSASTADHLKKAWGAIPPHLVPWLVDTKSVKLFGTENNCKKILEDVLTKQYPDEKDKAKRDEAISRLAPDACWHVDKDAVATNGIKQPTLYIADKVNTIHRRLITTAVYAFAEYYEDSILLPAVKNTPADKKESVDLSNIRDFADAFDKARTRLATAYVQEITAAENAEYFKKVVEGYKVSPLYGDDTSKWASNHVFKNFVVAEFTDAYYCNGATFTEFENKKLKNTRNAFLEFVQRFGEPWHGVKQASK